MSKDQPNSEQTPLLANQSDSSRKSSIQETFNRTLRNTSKSSNVQSEDESRSVYNGLVRHRSRLSSYPSLPDPENHDKKIVEAAAGQGAQEAGVEPGPEPQEPDSKYINISAGRFWLIFSCILMSYTVSCFDITLMASSHPVITSYFNASKSASWLTTVFMITNTGFQPLWGRLSDTIGRKIVYMLVMLIFALTNLWCGLSQSIGSFIAARAVCGLGAGGTMSMGLVILNDLVHIQYRGIYISHINVAFGLGSACGAAFGGLICDTIGWRWAFGIQVPVIVICMIASFFFTPNGLGPLLIKNSKPDEAGQSSAWTAMKSFDTSGVVILSLTVTFLILFLNLGGNIFPWKHPVVIIALVLFVVGSVLLWFVEKRAKQPVMPLRLLIKPPVANLTYANFFASIASNTVLFNVPLWFQAVQLTSPTDSGLRLAAPSIGGSLAGIASGYIITYTRRLKPTLLVGSVVYLAGSIALCCISRQSSTAVSLVLITGAPLAQGFIYPSTMMSAFAVSESSEQAVVTTTISLWRNLGIVIGVAISSLVFQNLLRLKLNEVVSGPNKEEVLRIIAQARSSVKSVKFMPPYYQAQVIEAYAIALKLTFVTAVVASVLLVIDMVPCKLPRLGKKSEDMSAPPGE